MRVMLGMNYFIFRKKVEVSTTFVSGILLPWLFSSHLQAFGFFNAKC